MREAISTYSEGLALDSVGNLIGKPIFRLLGGLLVFFGTVEFLTIGVSFYRVTATRGLAWGIIFFAGLFGGWYGIFLKSGQSEVNHPGETVQGSWLGYLAFALVIAWYGLLWVTAYLLPDASWDGLWYHNPTMHFWALRGYVHWITIDYSSYWTPIVSSFWNGYPKGVELLGFLIIRATGSSRLLNAINLPWIPLGMLGVYCLTRAAGTTRRWALLAGTLFIFIPLVITQAPTTYVDVATASCFIAFFAITILVVNRMGRGSFPWRLLPALGCGAGLTLGVKGTGVALFVIGMICLVIRIIVISIRCAGRDLEFGVSETDTGKYPDFSPGRPSYEHSLRRGIIFLLLTMMLALAVGGYWSIRNYIRTGSPLHPVGFAIGGYRIFPGILDPTSLIAPRYAPGTESWSQLHRLFFTWGQGLNPDNWRNAVASYTSMMGGLGYLWLIGCIPSIVYLLIEFFIKCPGKKTGSSGRITVEGKVIIPLVIMTAVLFVIIPCNHTARFTIWLYGLGLPCFALAAGRVWKSKRRISRCCGRIWVVFCITIAILEGVYSFCNQRGFRISAYQGEGSERCFSISRAIRGLSEEYPIDYAWPHLRNSRFEDVIAGNAPVALSGMSDKTGKDRILGHLTQGQSFGKRRIYFLDREEVAADSERLRRFIDNYGIRYIIWNTEEPIPRELARQVGGWDRVNGRFYLMEFY